MKKGWILSYNVVMCGIILIGIYGCPSQEPTLPGNDPELVGKWQGSGAGYSNLSVEFRSDGSFTISGSGGSQQSFTNYGSWTTDELQLPKWINVVNQYGITWLGIYEINGDSLKWYEQTGSRPTAFGGANEYQFTKQ